MSPNTFELKKKKKKTIRSTVPDVETLEPSNTGGWNIILLYSYFGNNSSGS